MYSAFVVAISVQNKLAIDKSWGGGYVEKTNSPSEQTTWTRPRLPLSAIHFSAIPTWSTVALLVCFSRWSSVFIVYMYTSNRCTVFTACIVFCFFMFCRLNKQICCWFRPVCVGPITILRIRSTNFNNKINNCYENTIWKHTRKIFRISVAAVCQPV